MPGPKCSESEKTLLRSEGTWSQPSSLPPQQGTGRGLGAISFTSDLWSLIYAIRQEHLLCRLQRVRGSKGKAHVNMLCRRCRAALMGGGAEPVLEKGLLTGGCLGLNCVP